MFVHRFEVRRVQSAQIIPGRRIVIHLLRTHFESRVVDVKRQPEFFNRDSQVWVVLQSQCDKVLDPGVGQMNGGQRQDVDLATLELFLGLEFVVCEIPVLNDTRSTDGGETDQHVVLDAGRFRHTRQLTRHKHVKTMPGRKNSQTLLDRLGRRGVVGNGNGGLGGKIQGTGRQADCQDGGRKSSQQHRWNSLKGDN